MMMIKISFMGALLCLFCSVNYLRCCLASKGIVTLGVTLSCCVCAALVSAAKVMCCIQCSLVVIGFC